jgi:hypothetical protein
MAQQVARLRMTIATLDSAKLTESLDVIRDVARRIQKVKESTSDFTLSERPIGIADTLKEYAKRDRNQRRAPLNLAPWERFGEARRVMPE